MGVQYRKGKENAPPRPTGRERRQAATNARNQARANGADRRTTARAAGAAKRAPSGVSMATVSDRTARVSTIADPAGLYAVDQWRKQLANPWESHGVGIPWGAPMPTFKQVFMYERQVVAVANVAPSTIFTTVSGAIGDFHAGGQITYEGSGNLFFTSIIGSAKTNDKSFQVPSGRLVAAAVRLTYRGIAEQLGGTAVSVSEGGATVPDVDYPGFSRVMESRYYPQTNFDLEFRDSYAVNTSTAGGCGIGLLPAGTGRTYLLQYVAIVEHNDDTPIAPNYAQGDFNIHHRHVTPQASSHMSDHLMAHVEHAKKQPVNHNKPHHNDPDKYPSSAVAHRGTAGAVATGAMTAIKIAEAAAMFAAVL